MKVRDPVCGMMIEQKDAKGTSSYQGTTYYFCATECKETFDREPAKYATAGATASPR
jgi:Cu+-exporting ATPase